MNNKKIEPLPDENKLHEKWHFSTKKMAMAAILFFEMSPKLFPDKLFGPRTYPENLKRLAEKLRLVER